MILVIAFLEKKMTISVGVIGLGYWGPNLLRVFDMLSSCVVKYCCEVNPKIRSDYQESYPHIAFVPSFETVLNDPDLDAIVIATPVHTHYSLAKKSLEHDKNVFVEKPITLDLAHAIEVTELAEQKNLTLMVGHLMLYHPAIEWLKEKIVEGMLGKVLYLYSQRVNLGRIRSTENAMWSLAPHDISIAIHLLEEVPNVVSATGYAYLQPSVEDVVFLNLGFSKGTAAHIHCSWLDPHKVRKLTVVGEKQMVVFDDMEKSEPLRVYDKGFDTIHTEGKDGLPLPSVRFGDIWVPHIDPEEPLVRECQHFLDSITNRTKPLSDGRSGIDVLRILQQANLSFSKKDEPNLF